MIKLTKEQIEVAATALNRNFVGVPNGNLSGSFDPEVYRKAATATAPYLQSPWEMPTEEEVESLFKLLDIPSISGRREYAHRLLRSFIERRNAALLPKPVDSRREKLIPILARLARWHVNDTQDHIVDAILAALDGK